MSLFPHAKTSPFALRTIAVLTLCGLIPALSGCSLFVMAGKSLFGDPEIESPFTRSANVDLREGLHKVIVVASTPEVMKAEFPATNADLIERVSRKLKSEGVQVINSSKVATWLDDHGGYWESVDELANAFDAEYVIHLEVDQLRLQDPNTPDLYQGFASGTVYGYEVRSGASGKTAHRIFMRPFERKYPDGYPKLTDRLSREVFHREFMTHLSLVLSQMLYDHRTSDAVF